MDILTIKKEVDNFGSDEIEIIDGLKFNQADTIKKIIYYYNSKFLTGNYDDQGDRKYFYNIVKNPCDVATKAIDFDTKNVNILTAEGGTPLKTWLFERDLKFWMKDKNFGKVLNRIFYELPIFGSVVLKVINNIPYFVDLRNFVVTQDAENLDKANMIVEPHFYTPLEFSRIAKKQGWNNWQGAIKENSEGVSVYEAYGEDEDLNYRRVIFAETGNKEGITLSDDKVKKHPYWEFHFNKMPGRWLGIGAVEPLIDPQVRMNEISNQQVKSSYWSALRLWQTRDRGMKRNLLTDAKNGDILDINDPLIQVDMADRNLSFYEAEMNRWLRLRDEVSFSREVTRGENLPSGTPLGSARLSAGMAMEYFGQLQENIALDVKEFLFNVILPNFGKGNTKEHYLKLVGEDLDKVHLLNIARRVRDKQINFFNRGKTLIGPELDFIKDMVSKNTRGEIKGQPISDGFYKDIKYNISIDITGEQYDTRVKAATIFAILQAITADPTMLQDPSKKKLLYWYMEQGGVSPIDFFEVETSSTMPLRAGGGVSRPMLPQTPIAGMAQATV